MWKRRLDAHEYAESLCRSSYVPIHSLTFLHLWKSHKSNFASFLYPLPIPTSSNKTKSFPNLHWSPGNYSSLQRKKLGLIQSSRRIAGWGIWLWLYNQLQRTRPIFLRQWNYFIYSNCVSKEGRNSWIKMVENFHLKLRYFFFFICLLLPPQQFL